MKLLVTGGAGFIGSAVKVWVPPGFAHGFYVMSEIADFQYKCTDFYVPEFERCIHWNDADLNIEWPILKGTTPTVSLKDAAGLTIKEAEIIC